jgi:hypothetical protein
MSNTRAPYVGSAYERSCCDPNTPSKVVSG